MLWILVWEKEKYVKKWVFYCKILGLRAVRSRHYLAKQGQVGTLGNRHVRPTHGFLKWGFRQNLHLLHLGAKQPLHFLHRARFLFPIRALDLINVPLFLDLMTDEIAIDWPHLQTILRFWIDRRRSKSVWAALSIMLSKVSGLGLGMWSRLSNVFKLTKLSLRSCRGA